MPPRCTSALLIKLCYYVISLVKYIVTDEEKNHDSPFGCEAELESGQWVGDLCQGGSKVSVSDPVLVRIDPCGVTFSR